MLKKIALVSALLLNSALAVANTSCAERMTTDIGRRLCTRIEALYEQRLADLQGRLRTAVSQGDTASLRSLKSQIDQLANQRDEILSDEIVASESAATALTETAALKAVETLADEIPMNFAEYNQAVSAGKGPAGYRVPAPQIERSLDDIVYDLRSSLLTFLFLGERVAIDQQIYSHWSQRFLDAALYDTFVDASVQGIAVLILALAGGHADIDWSNILNPVQTNGIVHYFLLKPEIGSFTRYISPLWHYRRLVTWPRQTAKAKTNIAAAKQNLAETYKGAVPLTEDALIEALAHLSCQWALTPSVTKVRVEEEALEAQDPADDESRADSQNRRRI